MNPNSCGVSRNRAQSNLVGFVLLLGLTIGGLGVTGAFLYDAYTDTAGSQSLQEAEANLETIQSGIEENIDGSPRRRSVMSASSSTRIAHTDGPTITVRYEDGGNVSNPIDVTTPDIGTITSTVTPDGGAEAQAIYSAGLVFRDNSNGEDIPVSAPAIRNVQQRTLIIIPNIQPEGPSAVGGGGSKGNGQFPVITRLNSSTTETAFATKPSGKSKAADGTIEVTDTDHPTAWERFFEAADGFSITGTTDSSVTAEFTAETVSVQIVDLEVRLRDDV